MKAYQIKLILKNTKPPVWKRCVVPAGITFSQLALVLDGILETALQADYEFEFYQAEFQVREWREGENPIRSFRFDYVCASDSYIDEKMERESWFTFRPGDGSQYRAEIEKSFEEEISCPSVVKQKDSEGIKGWSEAGAVNERLRERFSIRYGEPDYRSFEELLKAEKKGENGLRGASSPTDRTKRQKKSANTILKDFAGGLNRIWKGKHGGENLDEALAGEEVRCRNIKEFLSDESREALLEMAEEFELEDLQGLDAEELAERIQDKVLEPEVMEKRLLLLSDAEIEEFEEVIELNGYYPIPEIREKLVRFYEMSYVFLYADGYAEVPKAAVEVYKKINTPQFQEKRRGTFWIHRCLEFTAMVFRCAPEGIVRRMFKKCLGRKITPEEFSYYYENVPEEANPCVWCENRFMDEELFEDNQYFTLEAIRGDLGFYIPSPNEILDYTENNYPASDPYYRKLKTFLMTKVNLAEIEVKLLMPVLWSRFNKRDDISETAEVFGQNLHFPDRDTAKEFLRILGEVYNHTRMALYCGHTPDEVMAPVHMRVEKKNSGQESAGERGPGFPEMGKKKIYPNDPCPCGSGKKYKKCCGKNK